MDIEPTLERRFLGVVEVDSGTLLVGDPMYCLPCAKDATPGIDYEAIIGAPDEPASYLAERQVILLGAFGGDGTYPVFGEIDEFGELVRVTIEFVEPDDEDLSDYPRSSSMNARARSRAWRAEWAGSSNITQAGRAKSAQPMRRDPQPGGSSRRGCQWGRRSSRARGSRPQRHRPNSRNAGNLGPGLDVHGAKERGHVRLPPSAPATSRGVGASTPC